MKFRCDRDALSEALADRPAGGVVAARDPGADRRAARGGRRRRPHAHHDRPRGLGAARDRRSQVSEPGIALVPARLLGDTVKSLSNAPVEFEADQSQATIRCAAYEGTLRLLPAEDFPGLQEPSGTTVTAEAGAFAEAVGQVARGASRDEARPVLTGRAARGQPRGRRDGRDRLVPAGGPRARRDAPTARRRRSCPSGRCPRPAAPPRPTRRATVEIFVDESQVSFQIGALTLTSRLIEGEFPNYRQLLPEATRAGSRSRASSCSTP